MSVLGTLAAWAPPVFGGLIVGSLLHELGHVIPAAMAGGRPRIRIRWSVLPTPIVEYDASDMSSLTIRAIQLAPLWSGLCAGAVGYGLWGVPTGSAGVAAVLAWGLYTFGGGAEDYLPQVAAGDSWWWRDLEPFEQLVYLAFGVSALGFGLVMLGGVGRLAVTAHWLGRFALFAGVLFLLGAGFVREDSTNGAQAS